MITFLLGLFGVWDLKHTQVFVLTAFLVVVEFFAEITLVGVLVRALMKCAGA